MFLLLGLVKFSYPQPMFQRKVTLCDKKSHQYRFIILNISHWKRLHIIQRELQIKKEVINTILSVIVPVAQENSLQILADFTTIAIMGQPLDTDISTQGLSSRTYSTCFALFRVLGIKESLSKPLPTTECSLFYNLIVGLLTTEHTILSTATQCMRISIWAPFPLGAPSPSLLPPSTGRSTQKTPC